MKGFTLIEILVAVGIAMVIVGGVIVNYNAYNDTQKVKQVAQTLKNNLRFAQAQALAGRKPTSGCTTLVGFTVTLVILLIRKFGYLAILECYVTGVTEHCQQWIVNNGLKM